jgi:hypothetical protein
MFPPGTVKTISEISNALLLLATICVIGISCVALLSQAVRTAPNQSWHGNTDALLIGVSYIIVVRESFLQSRSLNE